MSTTPKGGVKDYFKSQYKGSENAIDLVHGAFEASPGFAEEERLAAFLLISPVNPTKATDLASEVNIFRARFSRLAITDEVVYDILDAALKHFEDSKKYPDVHPIIGQLNQFAKMSKRMNTILKEGQRVKIAGLWEEFVLIHYDNRYIQQQHEDLMAILSSQAAQLEAAQRNAEACLGPCKISIRTRPSGRRGEPSEEKPDAKASSEVEASTQSQSADGRAAASSLETKTFTPKPVDLPKPGAPKPTIPLPLLPLPPMQVDVLTNIDSKQVS